MTNLDYAREIAARYGNWAPVTWMTVGELIDILENYERLKSANNAHPVRDDDRARCDASCIVPCGGICSGTVCRPHALTVAQEQA